MPPQKPIGPASPRVSPGTAAQTGRKPWKKKTPVEVVLDQINRLRDDVEKKEAELNQAKKQLQKLEQARKLLEAD